jgi:hypothetical protein
MNVDFLEIKVSSHFGDLTLLCMNYGPKRGMEDLKGSSRRNA